MTTLLRFENISFSYGHRQLLREVDLTVSAGERIALIGRNGEGKSTLLRILAGLDEADGGVRWQRSGLRIGMLDQSLPPGSDQSVRSLIMRGASAINSLLETYQRLTAIPDPSASDLQSLARIQEELEACDGWGLDYRADTIISQLGLPADSALDSLSGGWRRHALLGRALLEAPDLLLLDEPTNHLDIPAIEWLEGFLSSYSGAVLFISHDRDFLDNVATRIIELDRGALRGFPAGFDRYRQAKAQLLELEHRENALFDKRLGEEERWIRQGIKARRTRNEGRVRRLEALRQIRRQRVAPAGQVKFQMNTAEGSGRLVVEAKHLGFGYQPDTPLVKDFSIRLMAGDKVGLIGANGAGKSTLIRLLLGTLKPTAGTVSSGTRLKIAYFDQLRDQLKPEATVLENIAEGRESVTFDGGEISIFSYLKRFLFAGEALYKPVSSLSGGERARLLLARLFSLPANVLVLDEPTNDLDMDTLDMLEELLVNFPGTLLLVTHDRRFLDNVVSSTLAFEGDGRIQEYVGGYRDWLRQGKGFDLEPAEPEKPAAKPAEALKPRSSEGEKSGGRRRTKKRNALTFKERHELAALPEAIEAAEARQRQLNDQVAAPGFYQEDQDTVRKTLQELSDLEGTLESLMDRWVTLESRDQAE